LGDQPRKGHMPKTIYFDCFSGASGDMILGALLDAGFPLETLRESLRSLDFRGYELSVERVKRSAITGAQFKAVLEEDAWDL